MSDSGLFRFRSLWKRFRSKTGTPDNAQHAALLEDIEDLVEDDSGPESGEMTDHERHLLTNMFRFRGLTAHDIMKPRADVQGLDINTTLPEVVAFFRESRLAVAPVYREQLDDTLGLVFLNDVLPFCEKPEPFSLQGLLKEVLFVSPSIRILELMIKMKGARAPVALVVDEFGGIDGLVTLEDMIEEIVGSIQEGESPEHTPFLKRCGDGSCLVDGRIPLDELQAVLETVLDVDDMDEDIETVGGFLTHRTGRVPARGEVIHLNAGFECEILDADLRRVRQVLVRPALHGSRPLRVS
jgi:magnesium and cobalt transporter